MEKDSQTTLRMLNSVKERSVMESSAMESMIDLNPDWVSDWAMKMKKMSKIFMYYRE